MYILENGKIVYAGSSWNIDKKRYHTKLNSGNYGWNAIWVTDDEFIAEKFAEEKKNKKRTEIPIVFKGKITRDLKLFEIEEDSFKISYYDGFEGKQEVEKVDYKQYMGFCGIEDPRDLIDKVDRMEYDGTLVSGSIGTESYEDIALFRSKDVRFTQFKPYNFEEYEFSEYYNERTIVNLFFNKENEFSIARNSSKNINSFLLKSGKLFSRTYKISKNKRRNNDNYNI
jgi:hypothetical protein